MRRKAYSQSGLSFLLDMRHSSAEYNREWCRKNPEKVREYQRKYRASHPEKDRERHREYSRRLRLTNPEKLRIKSLKGRRKARLEVLTHYSNGEMKCACCGENEVKFLTLDHINGRSDGQRAAGTALVQWIRKMKYPSGFQVLCFNCNCAKGFWGKCPHGVLEVEGHFKE